MQNSHGRERALTAMTVARIPALALAALACIDFGCGGGGSTPASAPAPALGDLPSEVQFAQSNGGGTIDVEYVPSLGGVGSSSIVNGQATILLNPELQLKIPELHTFFLDHELGHFYLDHLHRFAPCTFTEYEADAFGIRVLFATNGADAANTVVAWLLASGVSGDATHPPDHDRGVYAQQVLAPLLATPSDTVHVPPPPVPACSPAVTGTLEVVNATSMPSLATVLPNVAMLAALPVGQTLSFDVGAGTYEVKLQDAASLGVYFDQPATVKIGEITRVPQ